MKRRLLLGVLAAPMILRQPRAQAIEKITVRLDWLTWGGQAPFYLALQKGWYRDAGLDVDIEEGNGSVTTVQLVGNDNFDVGHTGLGVMMLARGKGMKIRAIATFTRKNDIGVAVPLASPIQTPKDFAGKKLIYTAGSFETPFIDHFLAAGGLTRDQLELVNVDASSKLPIYLRGDADGAFGSVPYFLPYTNARPARGILFADYGLQFPGFGLVASEDKIAARGPALAKFATIVSGAWQYIANGHEEEAIQAEIAAKPQQKLDPAILRAHLAAFKPYLTTEASKDLPCGVMAPKDWELAVAAQEAAGVLKPGLLPADFYTNALLDRQKIVALGGA